jgi:lysyl endopeptidase
MKLRLLTLLLLSSLAARAAPPSSEFALPELDQRQALALPAIDASKALAEDATRGKLTPGPVRYALGHAISGYGNQGAKSKGGTWSTLSDGRQLWRLDVHAPGAVSLDFGFTDFRLPAGAELWIVDTVGGTAQGPFTDVDNKRSGQFWTPLLRTDRARIEIVVPAEKRAFLRFNLDTVHQGYKNLFARSLGQKSGSCNVDVACPEGNAWRDEIRSSAVVAYNASGTRDGNGCSGQFVNSTAPTSGPLFLSANHCEIDGDSARVYFNFQNSVCRTPGSAASGSDGDGPLTATLFGAEMLAQTDPAGGVVSSDFALLRFDNQAPPAANLYLSGWDRRPLVPAGVTAIHHPLGDEKRISFENNALSITGYSSDVGGGTTHLRVADWDVGTTEQGSSGGGIWNDDGRLVGVLSGGAAACGNDDPDWFGRLSEAWDGLGTPATRVRDWLDPAGSNAQTLDGKNACSLGTTTLNSAAFATSPAAGASVTFDAATTGGSGGYTYSWDVDGDGTIDRSGPQSSVSLTYPNARSLQVSVRVNDAAGCTASVSRALDVVGAGLNAAAAAPQQVCGDNDAAIEPGERWRVPVTLTNNGGAPLAAGGRALFVTGAASTGLLPIGPNSFGHRATTSAIGGCSYAFNDIASGAQAVPALATSDEQNNGFGPLDDARTTQTIALGGSGFKLYGQTFTQAVMSTNGYVSFSPNENGGDYSNDCNGAYTNGGVGPQLRVHHDDLVVSTQSGAGLRYRYYPSCPRQAESDRNSTQGCHVFQWSRMQTYVAGGEDATGDFEFQAIAYERTGQVAYQYRSASPDLGAGATIGISNPAASDPLNVRCNEASAAPAQSAICVFDPAAVPSASSALRIESATAALGALNPAQSTTIDVPFAVRSDASCGAPLVIDYLGTAAPGSFSLANKTVLETSLGAGGTCQISSTCAAAVPQIATRQGLYSNPTRGGNGLANFIYGNNYGGAWYTALPNRTPTWYILAGPYADNLAAIPITRVRNTAAPDGFATASDLVGRAWVAQTDSDSLVLAYAFDDGDSGIELMDAQALPFSSPNRSQLWSGTPSGWGLVVETLATQPNTVLDFVGTYIYDSQGVARWVTGSTNNVTTGGFNLSAYRVHCPACPWISDWAASPLAAGSMTRTYTGPSTGTMSTSITLPAPMSGTWNRSNVPMQTLAPPSPAQQQ